MKKVKDNKGRGASRKDILIVLDRDGTINYDPGWFGSDKNWKKQLKLLDGVVEGIRELNCLGRVMVASNQFGVARGYFNLDTVLAINKKLDGLLKIGGAIVENWQVCPYVDYNWAKKQGLDLKTPWIKKKNTLRKPYVGMIKEGARELGMDYKKCFIFSIGNRLVDVETGLNAGGVGIIIKDNNYLEDFAKARDLSKRKKGKVFAVDNFLEAVFLVQSNFINL